MTLEEKAATIKYRFERAVETMCEARLMAVHSHWNAAASRIYYACFYALMGNFLKSEATPPTTHAGVKTKFNQKFVKTGLVSKELGVFYNKLFSRRQDGDYKDLVIYTADDVQPLIPEA